MKKRRSGAAEKRRCAEVVGGARIGAWVACLNEKGKVRSRYFD
jgi:hypothetical protein